jgi:hypothetical protein
MDDLRDEDELIPGEVPLDEDEEDDDDLALPDEDGVLPADDEDEKKTLDRFGMHEEEDELL